MKCKIQKQVCLLKFDFMFKKLIKIELKIFEIWKTYIQDFVWIEILINIWWCVIELQLYPKNQSCHTSYEVMPRSDDDNDNDHDHDDDDIWKTNFKYGLNESKREYDYGLKHFLDRI